MDPVLEYTQSRVDAVKTALREMVLCESPSGDAGALRRFADLLSAQVGDIAQTKLHRDGNVQFVFQLPRAARRAGGQVLALGHLDTVWPVGTLRSMPWREAEGRLWGPGVLDMKSGIAFFIEAMRALRELGAGVGRKVVLQLNVDEEVGSRLSRELTEREARRSAAVLVLEPGTGLEGKLKTARKGVGSYTVTVRGRASHAGVDFSAGASAIDELAHQIGVIGGFTNLKRGVTVNTGVIAGGTRSNVVAAEARAEVDFRVPKMRDWVALQKQFARLRVRDKRCRLELAGELNRPPMERTREIARLAAEARRLASDLGVRLEESATGGGSDGNFTAALGITTLDGLGGVGEGAHALHESILVDRIADRVALLAKLVAAI